MRIKLYELKDMTDSRMLMEHRLLPITIWFIYGLMIFLMALVLWASMGEIDVVVKARGTVRPLEAIGTMTSKITGKISSIQVVRDQPVSKGDLIMTLDDAAFQVQKSALLVEQTQMQADLKLTNRFIDGLTKGRNPFDRATEEAYYYQFEKYKMDNQLNQSSVTLSADKLSRGQKALLETQQLLQWLDLDTMPKKGDSISAGQKYKQFVLERDSLRRKLSTAKEYQQTLQTLYDNGSVSKMELETAGRELESANTALEAYVNTYRTTLTEKATSLQGQLVELEVSSNQSTQVAGIGSQINWQTSKLTLEKNLDLMAEKLKSFDLSIANCRVEATLSGVYSPFADYAAGDLFTEGTKIGTIVPETSQTYQAEMAIGNQDVGRILLGDMVKLSLDALPTRSTAL